MTEQARRPTIRQVSRAADVSVATVSRVLNGVSTVRPDLAERVLRIAAELGYQPNPVAQALPGGRTRMLGVLVPDLANPYFNQILKHLSAAASADGYRLIVADSDLQPKEELPLCRELLRQVDGLVLCAPRMPGSDIERLLAEDRPVVWINRQSRSYHLPAALVDSAIAMRAVRAHLEELGHTRIAYLSGARESWSNTQRWRTLTSRPGPLEVFSVQTGNTLEDGYAGAEKAMRRKPTALVCFNDIVAFGALSRLAEMGVGVPDEVSVTGFDDIPFASFTSPGLTTTSSPAAKVGRWAWELFERVLEDRETQDVIRFVPRLIARHSTAPAADAAGSATV